MTMNRIYEEIKVKQLIVSKYFLLFILLVLGFHANADKKYLIIDSTDMAYTIKHYWLNTHELYDTDFNIETYNIIFSKGLNMANKVNRHERILLVSLLPDVSTGELWEEIDENEIEGNTFDPKEYIRTVSPVSGFRNNVFDLKKFNETRLVKKESGRWWVSLNCLTESFEIVPLGLPYFSSVYGQLVLDQNAVTIKEFVENYPSEEYSNVLGIPLLLSGRGGSADNLNGWRTWKEFLSKTVSVNGTAKGYQFWTCAATNVADYYDVCQGVGRFIYVPGEGIIGGSYDFYFKKPPGLYLSKPGKRIYSHRLTSEQWDKNILEEKLMIAEGFSMD